MACAIGLSRILREDRATKDGLTTQRYDRRNREDIVRRLTMMLDE